MSYGEHMSEREFNEMYLENDMLPVVCLGSFETRRVILYTDAFPLLDRDGILFDPPVPLTDILAESGFRRAKHDRHEGIVSMYRKDAGLNYKVLLEGFNRVPQSLTRVVLFGQSVGKAAGDLGMTLLNEGYFVTIEALDGELFDLV